MNQQFPKRLMEFTQSIPNWSIAKISSFIKKILALANIIKLMFDNNGTDIFPVLPFRNHLITHRCSLYYGYYGLRYYSYSIFPVQ